MHVNDGTRYSMNSKRISEHYGPQVKEQFLKRLSSEIERRGTLDVLRRGVKDRGCAFRLA